MLRKNKLPKPRLQATMIAMFVVVCGLGLIVNFIFSISKVSAILGTLPEGIVLVDQVRMGLLTQLWLSLAVMVPVLVTLGMFVTFRVAGPMVALERHMKALAAGETPGPCSFRRGDELQELSELATRIGERIEALEAQSLKAMSASDAPYSEAQTSSADEQLTQ